MPPGLVRHAALRAHLSRPRTLSLLFGFQRRGGGVSALTNTSPPAILISTHHPSTTIPPPVSKTEGTSRSDTHLNALSRPSGSFLSTQQDSEEEKKKFGINFSKLWPHLSSPGHRVCVWRGTFFPAVLPVPSAGPRCVVSGQQRPQVSERADRVRGQRRGV